MFVEHAARAGGFDEKGSRRYTGTMDGDAEVWEPFARTLGGPLARGGGFLGGRRSIAFAIEGRPAVLEGSVLLGGDSEVFPSSLSVDLRGRSPGALKIYPESFFAPIARLFGAQDVRIGDSRFDSLYVVKANPESLAHSVFGGARRGPLIEAIRTLGKYMGFVIDLSRDRLLIRVAEVPDSEVLLARIVAAGRELVAAILENAPAIGVLWDEAGPRPGARCPVCGSSLGSALLHCGKCRTPHHRECWEYAGGCSTYACGGRSPG
jgi:hypothetical protein